MFFTIGYRLVELNAKTGQPVATFGKNGIVDLKEGVVIGKDKPIDLERGEIGIHSTPTVVNDMIIVGSSMAEGLGYRYSTNSKGLVRAFDARTGKQLWRFNTIPYPGEPGNETWENGSWEWTGNVGVWTQITVDPEDDLHGQWQAVRHRSRQRRQLPRRVHRVRAAGLSSKNTEPSGAVAVLLFD